MTAVASPPSVQPLSRWNPASNGAEALESMSAEEVSRMFMPRKSIQRQNSSSSITSSSASSSSSSATTSSTSTSTSTHPSQTNGEISLPTTNGDQGGWGPRKKVARGLWPSSKADPVSSLSTARSQALPTPSSGQSAASTMNSALQQPSSAASLQNRAQPQPQQTASRPEQHPSQPDQTAILALLPMTGTFDRKQIIVPYFPDVQKIGRQTNAKTIPTATNGFFDSKVLSRQHAEIWAERNGKILIRDVKSSNGTFVNGMRLSPENRDSEPHELREGDTLELGIDIVSEDQKSIVHHKVSAKVELAGLYNTAPTLLDMMHVDSNTGQPLVGDQLGQQLSQIRGRGGSQGSMGPSGRMFPPGAAGNNMNLLNAHRGANMWMAPITVEQVVKKLTGELKQAKQQSHDLNRTSDFFGALLALEPGQEPPKSPPKFAPEEKHINGVLLPAHIDSISPFSQPPAPPPQQPLPEKPDVARFGNQDGPETSPFVYKRTKTEKPGSTQISPAKEPQNGQVVSLLEALKSAKQEIDSQGDRVKHLEVALQRERKMREMAEKRARALSGEKPSSSSHYENSTLEEEAFDPPLDSLELIEKDLPNGHIDDKSDRESLLSSKASMETLKEVYPTEQKTEEVDSSASRLQAKLDLIMQEMNEMKSAMESYKRRAEDAEEGRKSLAEIVENLRSDKGIKETTARTNGIQTSTTNNGGSSDSTSLKEPMINPHNDSSHGLWTSQNQRQLPNGTAMTDNMHRELEKTISTVLQQQRSGPDGGGRMVQSAPYVSMVGVVLIGVGLMTWLNGWQPVGGDR